MDSQSDTIGEQQGQISHPDQQHDMSTIQAKSPNTDEDRYPMSDSELVIGPGVTTPSTSQLDDTLPVLPGIDSPPVTSVGLSTLS